jgi:endonuclease G
MALIVNPRADRALAAALGRAIKVLARTPAATTVDRGRVQLGRRQVRTALIPKEDLFGQERLIGTSDLVGIDFLYRALRAARSICRIRIDDGRGNRDLATGFLVAPNLLLTNHHVLPDEETAQYAQAEFDYENDINFVPKAQRIFPLAPSNLFYSDPDFDFAFASVVPAAQDGTPLSDFGWLPLIRPSGKAINGEWVSIIQHPKGERKQIVLRENRVVTLPPDQNFSGSENYLHYTADTERGSSGSAVFNDQFDVVALHHRGVGRLDRQGRPLTRDGKLWHEELGEDARDWIANEGVRISSIYLALESAASQTAEAQQVLQRLRNIPQKRYPNPGIVIASPEMDAPEGTASPPASFAGRKGYDPEFLPGFKIALPKLTAAAREDAAPVLGGGNVLDYTHFSVVISKSRRLARFTAVNIDGEQRIAPTKKPTWRTDGRVDERFQSDNELYKAGPNQTVDLQRGHLVRRLDPVWGKQAEANEAVLDTYHYTNAAPQAAVFNDQIWGNLEDYILQRAENKKRRVTVFTGPVFSPTDRLYGADRPGGPYKIPSSFWKVVAFIKPGSEPVATAFVLEQTAQIASLFEGFSPLSEIQLRNTQVKIEHIEQLSGLDFGALKQQDRFALIESMRAVSEIHRLSDIQL